MPLPLPLAMATSGASGAIHGIEHELFRRRSSRPD